MLQGSSTCGEGGSNARGFETREGEHVNKRIAGDGNRNIVAAVFALQTDVARNPPDGGMGEERRFSEALQDVEQVIVPPDVSQFMREQSFHVLARHSGERADRDENDRPEPSDHDRTLDQRGDQKVHGTSDPDPGPEAMQNLLPFGRRGTNLAESHAASRNPGQEQAKPENDGAREPRANEPRRYFASLDYGNRIERGIFRRCDVTGGSNNGCRSGFGRTVPAANRKGHNRSGDHCGQRDAGETIPGLRAPHPRSGDRVDCSDAGALPQEMEKCETTPFHHGLLPRFFSDSAIISRISASSFADAGFAESAPRINSRAEPSNARSCRSPAI